MIAARAVLHCVHAHCMHARGGGAALCAQGCRPAAVGCRQAVAPCAMARRRALGLIKTWTRYLHCLFMFGEEAMSPWPLALGQPRMPIPAYTYVHVHQCMCA